MTRREPSPTAVTPQVRARPPRLLSSSREMLMSARRGKLSEVTSIGVTGHRSIEASHLPRSGHRTGPAPGAGVRQRDNRGGSLLREHDAVDERVCPEKIGQIEVDGRGMTVEPIRSEEHTSELQSLR